MALSGIDQLTTCVELMASLALADCNYYAPSLKAYKKFKEAKELANLPTNENATFKGLSMFIVAPFVRDAVIGAGTKDPLELIPNIIHAGEQFDRDNATLDESYDKGVDHSEMFVE